MKTLLETGTTSENNSWVREMGVLTFDREKKAVRVHDGVIPGGYESQGTRVVPEPFTGPGAVYPTVGTTTRGYHGRVSTDEFISGNDLANAVGLTAGTPQQSTAPWFKFSLNKKTLFMAGAAFRYGLSKIDISRAITYNGIEITIGQGRYLVRWIDGTNSDTSEWNQLVYPIASSAEAVGGTAEWASLSMAELGQAGNGSKTLVNPGGYRGGGSFSGSAATAGVRFSSSIDSGSNGTVLGWRPMLELIGPVS